MILIISHLQDMHCVGVGQALQKRGHAPVLLDLARFPQLSEIELGYGNGRSQTMRLCDREWGDVDLSQCRAAWWRRPQPFCIPDEVADPAHRSFAMTEAREVFGGLWGLLDATWINDPGRDDLAHRKAYQLRVAESVGLTVPETLITNSPDAAGKFISGQNSHGAVFKPFNGTPQAWRETRLVKEAELERLDLVRIAPVIFQEFIDGVDLRITAIGDKLFPAEIDLNGGDYSVDFRMNYDNIRIRPTELPPDVEEGIHNLMRKLGLVYGAIDFRRKANGEHVFLEINPAGQWLFVEQQTEQPITDTLADTLLSMESEGQAL